MANCRMYIVCNVCGGSISIGKRMGGGYYVHSRSRNKGLPLISDMLNVFYDEHEAGCLFEKGHGRDHYRLEYDDPDKAEDGAAVAPIVYPFMATIGRKN